MSEDQNKDPYEERHEHEEVKVERVPLEETSDDGTQQLRNPVLILKILR